MGLLKSLFSGNGGFSSLKSGEWISWTGGSLLSSGWDPFGKKMFWSGILTSRLCLFFFFWIFCGYETGAGMFKVSSLDPGSYCAWLGGSIQWMIGCCMITYGFGEAIIILNWSLFVCLLDTEWEKGPRIHSNVKVSDLISSSDGMPGPWLACFLMYC